MARAILFTSIFFSAFMFSTPLDVLGLYARLHGLCVDYQQQENLFIIELSDELKSGAENKGDGIRSQS